MLRHIKKTIKLFILKKKFPCSVLHANVEMDKLSHLSKDSVIFQNVSLVDSKVGLRSYIQKNSSIAYTDIGNYCSIAGDVRTGLANHPLHMVSASPVFYDDSQPLPKFFVSNKSEESIIPRTSIGSDVWIGQSAIIKSGVNIGVGAVIAAGAVVVKDVQPYSIVGGCPAKHIKWRFGESVRNRLLQTEWWLLPDDVLARYSRHFSSPEEFLSSYHSGS